MVKLYLKSADKKTENYIEKDCSYMFFKDEEIKFIFNTFKESYNSNGEEIGFFVVTNKRLIEISSDSTDVYSYKLSERISGNVNFSNYQDKECNITIKGSRPNTYLSLDDVEKAKELYRFFCECRYNQ